MNDQVDWLVFINYPLRSDDHFLFYPLTFGCDEAVPAVTVEVKIKLGYKEQKEEI